MKIELEKPLDPDLAAEIEKQAAYVSPRIKNVRAYGKTIEWDGDDEKMQRFVAAMTAKHRAVPKKTIATRPFGELHSNVHAELVRRGWVFDLGRGQLGLTGPALALARLLDADCARIGDRFGAVERAFPSLIPASVLARCGYFGSFPQSVSFVAHLGEDFDRLEAFRTANTGSELVIPDRGDLVFEACLAPAVCYHAYQSLEGALLPEGGTVIGCAGKCYRYESSNLTGLERLWDFSMREIVFLGSLEYVIRRRDEAMKQAMAQLERFGLGGSIVSASDPFFPTTSATKRFFQAAADLKFELRLPLDAERSIAVASFNVHENFFGQAFSITIDTGEPACTACSGWGIERFVLACFVQHGFDSKGWPDALRSVFG